MDGSEIPRVVLRHLGTCKKFRFSGWKFLDQTSSILMLLNAKDGERWALGTRTHGCVLHNI